MIYHFTVCTIKLPWLWNWCWSFDLFVVILLLWVSLNCSSSRDSWSGWTSGCTSWTRCGRGGTEIIIIIWWIVWAFGLGYCTWNWWTTRTRRWCWWSWSTWTTATATWIALWSFWVDNFWCTTIDSYISRILASTGSKKLGFRIMHTLTHKRDYTMWG